MASDERVQVSAWVSPETKDIADKYLAPEELDHLLETVLLATVSEVASKRPRPLAANEIDKVVLRLLIGEALQIDGEHHKQWYLEEIARRLDLHMPEHEPGIAP